MSRGMSRWVLGFVALALVVASPAAAATSWAQPQIKVVTARGLMGGKGASFRPDDPLTAGELSELIGGLTGRAAPSALNPTVPVTISQLDAELVRAFGLLPAARQFSTAVRAAGLVPTRYF